MCMALGTESLDALGERIESLMDLQPPQGVVAKMKALGKLRELASFSAKTVKDGPCQEVWLDEPDLDLLPDPHLLAGRRRPVRHAAAGLQPRPAHRRAQLRHVPHPEARPAHGDDALADPQGRRRPPARLAGARARGGGHRDRTRPRPTRATRAAAAGHRRDDLRRASCAAAASRWCAAARWTSRCRPSREVVLEGYVDADRPAPRGARSATTPASTRRWTTTRRSTSPACRCAATPSTPPPSSGPPPMEDFFLGKATERLFLPIIRMTLPGPGGHEPPARGRVPQLRDRLGATSATPATPRSS